MHFQDLAAPAEGSLRNRRERLNGGIRHIGRLLLGRRAHVLADETMLRLIAVCAWEVLTGKTIETAEAMKAVEAPDVGERLRRLRDAGALEVDPAGQMVQGVLGATLRPTRWRMYMWSLVYGRSLADALAWFRTLGENGRIEGDCSECGRPLILILRKGKAVRVGPGCRRSRCLVESLELEVLRSRYGKRRFGAGARQAAPRGGGGAPS